MKETTPYDTCDKADQDEVHGSITITKVVYMVDLLQSRDKGTSSAIVPAADEEGIRQCNELDESLAELGGCLLWCLLVIQNWRLRGLCR